MFHKRFLTSGKLHHISASVICLQNMDSTGPRLHVTNNVLKTFKYHNEEFNKVPSAVHLHSVFILFLVPVLSQQHGASVPAVCSSICVFWFTGLRTALTPRSRTGKGKKKEKDAEV